MAKFKETRGLARYPRKRWIKHPIPVGLTILSPPLDKYVGVCWRCSYPNGRYGAIPDVVRDYHVFKSCPLKGGGDV